MLLDRRVPLAQFVGRDALLLQRQLAKRLRDRFLRRLVAAQHLDRFGAAAAGEGVARGRHQVVGDPLLRETRRRFDDLRPALDGA